jgi:hypothetical protein
MSLARTRCSCVRSPRGTPQYRAGGCYGLGVRRRGRRLYGDSSARLFGLGRYRPKWTNVTSETYPLHLQTLKPRRWVIRVFQQDSMSPGDAMTMGLQKEVAGRERSPCYIDELIRGRRTKRGFTNKAVPIDLVRDILSISKFAPSSSNTQPWQCYVLTGIPVSGSLLPPSRLSTTIRRI